MRRIINIIKCFYSNFTWCICQGDLSFEVKTGVRQGCVMCHVIHAIQYCYWLGPLSNNGRSTKRHKMDPFYYTWRPRLRKWFSSIVPPTTAHSGKDRPAQHLQQPGLRISLKKTEAMCPFPNKDQGKRTGHSIHHQVHILRKCALPRGY